MDLCGLYKICGTFFDSGKLRQWFFIVNVLILIGERNKKGRRENPCFPIIQFFFMMSVYGEVEYCRRVYRTSLEDGKKHMFICWMKPCGWTG